jgi:lipopolysaccharide export system permease protein
MSTITRYILRELLLTFLLAMVALNFIVMTEKVLWLTRVLSAVGVSLADIGRVVLLLQPQITVLTAPIALLMAVLLTYGRLNTDSELVVLRSSGMSFGRIARPVFILGAGCFAASAVLSASVAPASAAHLTANVADLVASRAPHAIEEGVFTTTIPGIMVYVRERPREAPMRGIFIYDERIPGRPIVVSAREGEVRSGAVGERDAYRMSFVMRDGRITFVQDDRTTDLSFGAYVMHVPVTLRKLMKKYPEMTPAELLGAARTASGRERTTLLLELHRRATLPALSLVLMVLGPPLSLMAGKTGRLGGLTVGLAVFALYYAALVYAENLARAGSIEPATAAWLPLASLAALAAVLFLRARRI